MENKILILSLFFISLFACSSDENTEKIEEKDKLGSIIGKWQLYEKCSYDAFTEITCTDVKPENQYYYKFNEDGTVETTRYSVENCSDGFFKLRAQEIYMQFSCTSYTIPIEKLNNTELHFLTAGEDGGTIYKYKKVTE